MTFFNKKTLLAGGLLTMALSASADGLDINNGLWNIVFNSDTKTITYKYNGTTIIDGAYIQAGNKPTPAQLNDAITSTEYTDVTLSSEAVDDGFGAGTKYTYTYKADGKNDLEQIIYIYAGHPYLLTQTAVVSASDVTYNYVSAIKTETASSFLPAEGDNRVFDMPFDNDDWHTFNAIKWKSANTSNTSSEATAFFDTQSRKGLIIGTVDHDTWKTGAYVKTSGSANEITALNVYAGYVSRRTWDVSNNNPSLTRHGAITGKRVASARVLVGVYDDWRAGLEDYGRANAIVTPKRKWDGGAIFGWQSWGGMAQYLNYAGASEVSNYFNSNLPHVKNDQGKTFMILDSFWDNMSDQELANFVRRCERNGQIPGIYDTPYTFWGGADQVDTWGTGIEGYNYGDIVLRAGGKPRKISGVSLDPTHPVTKQLVKSKVDRLKNLGFKYIKIDFMNNAALEADSYYDKSITTGMQAYNEGLRYYAECCGDDMFINLSIAPVWPAQYAQGRRIGCDAWGALDQSMYTLNCMNLSWWLEEVYSFNDPDHVVYMDKTEDSSAKNYSYKAWSENWNRVRTTTGVMCGTMVLGDNFSLKQGTCKGIQDARDRAELMTSNPELVKLAQQGKMFKPVDGTLDYDFHLWGRNDYCDNTFVLDTDEAWYVAVFNFKNAEASATLAFDRLGIDKTNVKAINELWTSSNATFDADGFAATVPAEDVRLYKIEKGVTGVAAVEAGQGDIKVKVSNGQMIVDAPSRIAAINVYGLDGRCHNSVACNSTTKTVDMNVQNGIYVVNVVLKSGLTRSQKVII